MSHCCECLTAAELDGPAVLERVVLSDGGVYDDRGLETAFMAQPA
jgi:hypothetical protein